MAPMGRTGPASSSSVSNVDMEKSSDWQAGPCKHSRRTVSDDMSMHHRGVPSEHFTPFGNEAGRARDRRLHLPEIRGLPSLARTEDTEGSVSPARVAAGGTVMVDRQSLVSFVIQRREPALSLDGRWPENGLHGAE